MTTGFSLEELGAVPLDPAYSGGAVVPSTLEVGNP